MEFIEEFLFVLTFCSRNWAPLYHMARCLPPNVPICVSFSHHPQISFNLMNVSRKNYLLTHSHSDWLYTAEMPSLLVKYWFRQVILLATNTIEFSSESYHFYSDSYGQSPNDGPVSEIKSMMQSWAVKPTFAARVPSTIWYLQSESKVFLALVSPYRAYICILHIS